MWGPDAKRMTKTGQITGVGWTILDQTDRVEVR